MRPPLYSRFWLCAGLLASAPAWAGTDLVRLPEFDCRKDEAACFNAARQALEGSADDQDALLKRRTTEKNAVPIRILRFGETSSGRRTEYSVGPARTPLVFIFIHGLYGAPAQFERQADYAAAFGMNSLTLTLAGHGDQYAQAKKVDYADWIEETGRAVKLARALGERVVIVGQSTGGMLAVGQALRDPRSIDGIVLLEPAIEVPPLLRLGLCVGKLLGDTPQDVPRITRWLGHDPCKEQPISLSMGCEVTRLRDFMVGQYLSFYRHDSESGTFLAPDELSRELGELVNVPTLLINNPGDQVVRPQAAENLYRGIAAQSVPAMKVELVEGRKHGEVTVRDERLVAESISQFLVEKMKVAPEVAESIRARAVTRSEAQAKEREEQYRQVEEANRRRREWQNRASDPAEEVE